MEYLKHAKNDHQGYYMKHSVDSYLNSTSDCYSQPTMNSREACYTEGELFYGNPDTQTQSINKYSYFTSVCAYVLFPEKTPSLFNLMHL